MKTMNPQTCVWRFIGGSASITGELDRQKGIWKKNFPSETPSLFLYAVSYITAVPGYHTGA